MTNCRWRPDRPRSYGGGMPIGIVTGASRGLGLALARALVERGWRLVVDARGGDALERASGPAWPASSRSPATSPTRAPARAGRGGRRPTIDLLVNNASVLGPSPQPALADYPLDELRRVYEVNVLAPLALVQARTAAARARRPDPERHLRRGRRALRGLGRLRLVEGGARPADRDPRRGAPGAARLRGRPGRHAHADAPGGVPRRGHLRPPAAGGERARPAGADRRLAAERPLPRARPRRSRGMSALEPAVAWRPTSRRRCAGSAATTSPARRHAARRSPRARALRRAAALPRRRRPAGRQHVGDAAGGARRAARRTGGRAAPLDPRGRRDAGLVELRTPTGEPFRRPPVGARCAPRRCARRAARAVRRRRAPRGRALELPSRSRTTCGATAGRSATATSRSRGRSTPTRRSSRSSRAAPRCPAPAGPFTTELVTELVARGVLIAPVTLHTGVSSPERGEPPYPERFRVARRRPRSSTRSTAGAARVIAVGTTVVRALETRGRGRWSRSDGRRLDRASWSRPSVASAPSTAS